jgi:CRP-like cAMP-binding protein
MIDSINSKLDSFFSKYKQQQYKKKEVLIRADEDPSYIFYLKKGKVRQYIISQKGGELVLNIFKPNSFFPMSHAINNIQNIYYFEAISEIDVWRAPKNEVVQFIKNNPDVQYDLLSRLYKGIDGLLTKMSYLMSASAYERLTAEIIILSKRFASMDFSKTHEINLEISENELATLTGLTRETVSRELKVLRDKNLISFAKKKLTIYNLNELEAELSNNY